MLTIATSGDCALSDTVLATAQREATTVWSRAHVALRWVPMAELPYRSPRSDWLVVQCFDGPPPTVRPSRPGAVSIAAIRFVDSQPLSSMMVSLGNARTLLNQDVPESRAMDRRFLALKEKRFGRIIGRAMAHEIGHFLAKSMAHTETGLMRAAHSVGALTGESLGPFRVEHADLVQLVAEARPRTPLELPRPAIF